MSKLHLEFNGMKGKLCQCVYNFATEAESKRLKPFKEHGLLLPETDDKFVVKFKDLKQYTYFVPEYLEVQPGDSVVVWNNNGFSVCTVVDTDQTIPRNPKTLRPVVAKFDLSGWFFLVEQTNKVDRLREELAKRRKILDAELRDKMYAERDPEFAELMSQLKSLGGYSV